MRVSTACYEEIDLLLGEDLQEDTDYQISIEFHSKHLNLRTSITNKLASAAAHATKRLSTSQRMQEFKN